MRKNTFLPQKSLTRPLILILGGVLLAPFFLVAQPGFFRAYGFSRADTLRGMMRPERTCYDVTYYDLNLRIDEQSKQIDGYVDIRFKAMHAFRRLQIDLYENMQIDSIVYRHQVLGYERQEQAVFVDFPRISPEEEGTFRVYYRGVPVTAPMAPWHGGFVWSRDEQNNPWIGVACEGDGASLWWPNKDHLSDEPDSMGINITVRNPLVCISNGNLRGKRSADKGWTEYRWFVSYPINNYNVTVNIGDYTHFSDTYTAFDGDTLALDYYVLRENEQKARQHFQQVPKVLACFERYFGKYPFWKDGYALVETPYLGMEHQSAIAYGNKYKRGYLGGMIPQGMDWDYIIVHETGHEYWGNSISCRDLAEMWIHESFTTYMEALYVECAYSYEDAVNYLNFQRPFIRNQEPILGPRDVNWDDWKGSDHYYKGAWVLHTLRHAIDNDAQWFEMLRTFYEKNALGHVTTRDFVEYVNTCTGKNWTPFFDQYLVYTRRPVFQYRLKELGDHLKLEYRWDADVPNFEMPLDVQAGDERYRIQPVEEWQSIRLKNAGKKDFAVAGKLFYIQIEEL